MYMTMWSARVKQVLLVAVFVGSAHARRSCNTAQFGELQGYELHIEDQRMSPGVPDWNLRVPAVCAKTVGVTATTCDVDRAPLIYLSSLTQGLILRTGELKTGAYVYVTVYCDPMEANIELLQLFTTNSPLKIFTPKLRLLPTPLKWLQGAQLIWITTKRPYLYYPPQRTQDDSLPIWSDQQFLLQLKPYPVDTSLAYRSEHPILMDDDISESDSSSNSPPNYTWSPSNSSLEQKDQAALRQEGPWEKEPSEIESTTENTDVSTKSDPSGPASLLKQLAVWWLKQVRWLTNGKRRRKMSNVDRRSNIQSSMRPAGGAHKANMSNNEKKIK